MKFGISTWVWTSPATTEALEKLIPHIAGMGFDVVELPLEEAGQFDVGRVLALANEQAVDVSICAVIGPGRDLLLEDESARGIAYLRNAIDVASEMGSPAVAGPLYSAVGRCWRASAEEREADVRRLLGIHRSLGDYALEKGVSLAIEPLNRFETSFINTTEQAVEFVRRVDHPAIGLCLDTFHLAIEEKRLGDAIRLAGPHLKHVQVADNDRGTPGAGQLRWDEVADALKEVGYDGRVVIETFSDRVESIARAAAIWRPLAESPDALAGEGLKFLKELFAPVHS